MTDLDVQLSRLVAAHVAERSTRHAVWASMATRAAAAALLVTALLVLVMR